MKRLDPTYLKRFEAFDNHEAVFSFSDPETGLRGFIAIHSTILGPATGGTRYWSYASDEAALGDVLRLSKAMTYKCALAGVPFGGGKGVIIANPGTVKSEAMMRSYARMVNELGGTFSTGEDAGIDEADVRVMAAESSHINGHPDLSGDPSLSAALGVFYALKPALKMVFGAPTVTGKRFAIQGLGKVGLELCRLLNEAGGILVGADIDPKRVALAHTMFPNMTFVSADEIHQQAVDVFSPCALGSGLNSRTIPQLRARIVCGAANNQLASVVDGGALAARNIVYVPDYAANAGGLINAVDALEHKKYDRERVRKKVEAIQETIQIILGRAHSERKPTSDIADQMVRQLLTDAQRIFKTV